MKILVADDEPKLGRVIADMLKMQGHGVDCVVGGRDALAQLARARYDLVLTDLRMPDADGLAVLEAARKQSPAPEVIVMTAFATTTSAVEAMKLGAVDYLIKPFAMDELQLRVARIAAHRSSDEARDRLVEQLVPALVAESPAMRAVLQASKQVAASDATVLLLGESGTGKSQLARYIHFGSSRRAGPFVEVHCAALPETLLESELFGHEKGAFTGADRKKAGLLSAADRGTLFLDEIGEISGATQVKLLRFLQNREFVPVGGSAAEKVDVRVVAATNRDLEEAVRRGAFREDLFYRINVFPIHVPPLRERREDMLPLAQRFLAGRGVPVTKLGPDARRALEMYGWPGNVRELENAMERALIVAGEDPIAPMHLLVRTAVGEGAGPPAPDMSELAGELLSAPPGSFDLDRFEQILLATALERTGGNKSAAARLLGITRRRLYSRLKSLSERADSGREDPGE